MYRVIILGELTSIRYDNSQVSTDHGASLTLSPGQKHVDHSCLVDDISSVAVSLDIWSDAYREAVQSLGEDIGMAILKGKNVAQLFMELEEFDKEATQESAFLRGVRYLHTIQVPLERFKLALDLASPLTSIEPTASTVFGVVQSVTAVSNLMTVCSLPLCKGRYFS